MYWLAYQFHNFTYETQTKPQNFFKSEPFQVYNDAKPQSRDVTHIVSIVSSGTWAYYDSPPAIWDKEG